MPSGKPSGTYKEIRDPELGLYSAFVPNKLVGQVPTPDKMLDEIESSVSHALGGLDAIIDYLPDPDIFLYSYVRKEAILSSQIEGTRSSISDLLLFESDAIPGVPIDDVEEVSTYVKALNRGLQAISEGTPINASLLTDLHRILLSGGRGKHLKPGLIRTSQNWVGGERRRPFGADYIPPPASELPQLLTDLAAFVNDRDLKIPAIRRAAIAHAQFESIHPFYDGNGRIGRMLVALILSRYKALRQPLLYLSLYLKLHRFTYYDRLQNVREESRWNDWFDFFYTGVVDVAKTAGHTARELQRLFERDKRRIEAAAGRMTGSVLRVHEVFKKEIVARQPEIRLALGLSAPTVAKAIRLLRQLGIVREISGKQRYGVFAYERYIDILNEGAEPIE